MSNIKTRRNVAQLDEMFVGIKEADSLYSEYKGLEECTPDNGGATSVLTAKFSGDPTTPTFDVNNDTYSVYSESGALNAQTVVDSTSPDYTAGDGSCGIAVLNSEGVAYPNGAAEIGMGLIGGSDIILPVVGVSEDEVYVNLKSFGQGLCPVNITPNDVNKTVLYSKSVAALGQFAVMVYFRYDGNSAYVLQAYLVSDDVELEVTVPLTEDHAPASTFALTSLQVPSGAVKFYGGASALDPDLTFGQAKKLARSALKHWSGNDKQVLPKLMFKGT